MSVSTCSLTMSNTAKSITSGSTPSLEVLLNAALDEGVRESVFPGAALLVLKGGDIQYLGARGQRATRLPRGEDPSSISIDTVFDLGHVSGTVATTTMLMKLVEGGRLALDDRVSRYLQTFGVLGKSAITIRQLLNHTSGLAAWHPFYEELDRLNSGARRGVFSSRGATDYILNVLKRCQLKSTPGSKMLQSDLGFILLGEIIEMLTGLPLDKATAKYITQPLGLRSTSFIDLSLLKRRGLHPVSEIIAPTEECAWRGRVLCGEAHDENAWAMGGVAGHSGLFSTVRDVGVLCSELIKAYHGNSEFLSANTVRAFWQAASELGPWRLGWEVPTRENGLAGSGFAAESIGVTSLTGCSIWLVPEMSLSVVLLSNRINLGRSNKRIVAFRAALHEAIVSAFVGSSASSQRQR